MKVYIIYLILSQYLAEETEEIIFREVPFRKKLEIGDLYGQEEFKETDIGDTVHPIIVLHVTNKNDELDENINLEGLILFIKGARYFR